MSGGGYAANLAVQVQYQACDLEVVYYSPRYLHELGVGRSKGTAAMLIGPNGAASLFDPVWEFGPRRKTWSRFLMKVRALALIWAASDGVRPNAQVRQIASDGALRVRR